MSAANHAQYAAVTYPVGSDDAVVVAVAAARDDLVAVHADSILEIYRRGVCYDPHPGDRLGTWVDGSTRYLMARRIGR